MNQLIENIDQNDNNPLGSHTSPSSSSSSSFPTSSTPTRKPPFRGFKDDSREELLLLRTMVNHNPFIAAHGLKAGTWDKIVENLILYDRDAIDRGESPMFEGVTVKTCKLRWDALFQKYKERVNKILNSTGVVVNETERERLIEQLYTNQVDAQSSKASVKAANDKKRQKQEQNKALGETLRAESINKACYSSRVLDTSEGSSSSSSAQQKKPYYESKSVKKKGSFQN